MTRRRVRLKKKKRGGHTASRQRQAILVLRRFEEKGRGRQEGDVLREKQKWAPFVGHQTAPFLRLYALLDPKVETTGCAVGWLPADRRRRVDTLFFSAASLGNKGNHAKSRRGDDPTKFLFGIGLVPRRRQFEYRGRAKGRRSSTLVKGKKKENAS